MVVGLKEHREKSLRLDLFAESLGLTRWDRAGTAHEMGSGTMLPGHRHALMLSTLMSAVTLMDSERNATRMRKDQVRATLTLTLDSRPYR